MSSVNFTIPAKTWVAITSGETGGSIYHADGDSKVVYTESASAPGDYGKDTPILNKTRVDDAFPFWDVAATDLIYAWAGSECVVSVTPRG